MSVLLLERIKAVSISMPVSMASMGLARGIPAAFLSLMIYSP